MLDKQVKLTGGRRLASNVVWNLLGTGVPLLVAIIAIPLLIQGLGTARFGVLALAWMVIGYFSLFDLGFGRALTKLVAEKLGKGQDSEIPSLIWTAMSLMAVLGVLGAVIVAAISPWLVSGVLNIPSELQSETLTAFYLLAASIPIVIGSTGLRGILEAHQRFGLVNVVRIPLGIFTFLGPVAVLFFSKSLFPIVAVLVMARLVSLLAYVILCFYIAPDLRRSFSLNRAIVKPLIKFGGWMSVTNIVGPLMVYMDRFLIGAVLTMTAVAYYATPYEIVTKLWIVPGALMGVMFPAFSASFVQNRIRAVHLFERTVSYIFISLFPAVVLIVTFAQDGLALWLDSEFAVNSSIVLQLLAIGVFINSHAFVPFGMVQGIGRPDLTAKLHLIELPFYLLLLWYLLNTYGIVGVAIAWVVRVLVDAVCLFVMAHKLLSLEFQYSVRLVLIMSMALSVLALGMMIQEGYYKVLFLLFVLPIFTAAAWLSILTNDEKDMICSRLKVTSMVNK